VLYSRESQHVRYVLNDSVQLSLIPTQIVIYVVVIGVVVATTPVVVLFKTFVFSKGLGMLYGCKVR